MTDPSQAGVRNLDERRKLYFDEYSDRIDRHRGAAAFWEQRAIEFATSAMKVLTYLNGGGLVAIPAAVALFKADPRDVRTLLVTSAALFIAGLVLITVGQAWAFLVMARRGESENLLQHEEMDLLAMIHYPGSPQEQLERQDRAKSNRAQAETKMRQSNIWRAASLICVWASLAMFIAGRCLGGIAILQAK